MATDLHDLSIAELAALIAARKLSPVELTEALIQRVERFDAQTRAFITPTFWPGARRGRRRPRSPAASTGARYTGFRSRSRTSTTRRAS
jgi:Asp-tRNA(Asn)/Glu-tRNA(Gln) amidotransferase A subunit family amidase